MRRSMVAGNWKLNGDLESIQVLMDGIKAGIGDVKSSEVVVCAPFVYLCRVIDMAKGSVINSGGQDLSQQEAGAFTGDVAGNMLKDIGCKYVIVGHSERRTICGESNFLVAEKYAAAQKAGLIPILCVGELLEQREKGITEEVVGRQIDAVIDLCGVASLQKSIVAYEPVWAIGTGETASPEQAQAVHAFIRGKVGKSDQAIADDLRILYGGSVKGDNAVELFSQPDIDGGLIGGASLKADEFLSICRAG
jgi:triosephosphate isomerase (TIM)